jgi:hypothetical protein
MGQDHYITELECDRDEARRQRDELLNMLHRFTEQWRDIACELETNLKRFQAPAPPTLRDNGKLNQPHEYQEDPETWCCVICGWGKDAHRFPAPYRPIPAPAETGNA